VGIISAKTQATEPEDDWMCGDFSVETMSQLTRKVEVQMSFTKSQVPAQLSFNDNSGA